MRAEAHVKHVVTEKPTFWKLRGFKVYFIRVVVFTFHALWTFAKSSYFLAFNHTALKTGNTSLLWIRIILYLLACMGTDNLVEKLLDAELLTTRNFLFGLYLQDHRYRLFQSEIYPLST